MIWYCLQQVPTYLEVTPAHRISTGLPQMRAASRLPSESPHPIQDERELVRVGGLGCAGRRQRQREIGGRGWKGWESPWGKGSTYVDWKVAVARSL